MYRNASCSSIATDAGYTSEALNSFGRGSVSPIGGIEPLPSSADGSEVEPLRDVEMLSLYESIQPARNEAHLSFDGLDEAAQIRVTMEEQEMADATGLISFELPWDFDGDEDKIPITPDAKRQITSTTVRHQ